MAVLIEGISVLVRRDAIQDRFPGGWDAFLAIVPNQTLCADEHLARVGFMVPSDVGAFVDQLLQNGLRFMENDTPRDIMVVDQVTGPTRQCSWIEFGSVELGPQQRVAAARYAGDKSLTLECPDGWTFEAWASARMRAFSNDEASTRTRFLRHENGLDVYLEVDTGKELFVGRTHVTDG